MSTSFKLPSTPVSTTMGQLRPVLESLKDLQEYHLRYGGGFCHRGPRGWAWMARFQLVPFFLAHFQLVP